PRLALDGWTGLPVDRERGERCVIRHHRAPPCSENDGERDGRAQRRDMSHDQYPLGALRVLYPAESGTTNRKINRGDSGTRPGCHTSVCDTTVLAERYDVQDAALPARYATGGVCFGYSLYKETGPNGKPIGTKIEINEEQAKVVRWIHAAGRRIGWKD